MRPEALATAGAVVVGLLVAGFAPGTAAGGVAAAGLVAAAGAALAWWWPSRPRAWRAPSPRTTSALALAVVAIVAIAVSWDALDPAAGWHRGDWGPQHAVLRAVLDAAGDGHLPTWTHALSTGDAPLEMYPALTYLVAAGVAWVGGWTATPMTALLVLALVVHAAIALGIARLALRVAPAPIAAAVGVLALVDGGALSAGGLDGSSPGASSTRRWPRR
ncbi:MAG: hypothetical protein R2939_05720 [Kofleriaceae bacterium]